MTQTDSQHNGESDYLEATNTPSTLSALTLRIYQADSKLNSYKVIDTELGSNEADLTCDNLIIVAATLETVEPEFHRIH